MPLYEYQCKACDTHFERIERVSALSDGVCPSCGSAAQRLLGAPALKFKGTGWYVTDYGKGNGNGSTPTAKSEAKHEAKTETSTTTESSTKNESSTKSQSTPKSNSKVA